MADSDILLLAKAGVYLSYGGHVSQKITLLILCYVSPGSTIQILMLPIPDFDIDLLSEKGPASTISLSFYRLPKQPLNSRNFCDLSTVFFLMEERGERNST